MWQSKSMLYDGAKPGKDTKRVRGCRLQDVSASTITYSIGSY